MLIALYENGRVIERGQASAAALEVHQNAAGLYQVQDRTGTALAKPVKRLTDAVDLARMFSKLRTVRAALKKRVR